ncbi:hypothetical protein V2J09_009622 [Rumex salicifolius]
MVEYRNRGYLFSLIKVPYYTEYAVYGYDRLGETPDWDFMRSKQGEFAFLFGIDDHWGPLTMFEEISKQAPDIPLSIEEEGHTHAFACTEAGSLWVAKHVACRVSRM